MDWVARESIFREATFKLRIEERHEKLLGESIIGKRRKKKACYDQLRRPV